MIKYKKIPSTEYKKILDNMPIACVDLLIYDGNKSNAKFLLVLRKDEPAKNEWFVPGGRIFKNEKIEDAAKRKAFEELGIKIKLEKQIGCYDLFFEKGIFPDIKDGTHTISVVYLATLEKNQKIKLDKTSLDYKWFSKNDKLHPYVRKLIETAGI